MHEKYYIKLYDTPLIEFEMYHNEYKETKVKVLDRNLRLKHLFPTEFLLCEESGYDSALENFLTSRTIPKGRKYAAELLNSLGLRSGDIKGIIDIGRGLSLNDSYSVLPIASLETFSQINLFDNDFPYMTALIAYTGTAGKAERSPSPELSANGMLHKAWTRNEKGRIFLLKGASEKLSNGIGGKEPYSEFLCSQIAEQMGLFSVSYSLKKWHGEVASSCELFCSHDISYVPYSKYGRDNKFSDICEHYFNLDFHLTDDLRSMLLFDSIVFNIDRHSGNFGFLRNNSTGEIFAAAPVFDNGMSVINFTDNDFEAKSRELAPAQEPLTFDELASYSLQEKQIAQLERLRDLRLHNDDSFQFDEKSLSKFQLFIRSRAEQLLDNSIKYTHFKKKNHGR